MRAAVQLRRIGLIRFQRHIAPDEFGNFIPGIKVNFILRLNMANLAPIMIGAGIIHETDYEG